MAQIRVDLSETLLDGMDIKFKAPCACNEITGLIVYYPAEDETIKTRELAFRDAHGNDLTGMGNLFSKDAYVKVIADTVNGYAYLQNADNNGYLNSAIFGTYTHDAENLIGWGENGKFKATVSGTISSINVNGVPCSVKCGEDSSMDLIAGCWYTFILDGNTVNFNSGGAGGGGLNVKVVDGTSAPASPNGNIIWVNCEGMTGWHMAAEQPENMKPGEVWISTGTSSAVAFNAAKKNTVMVYPISAKQMGQNGVLIDVTAKSWQDGQWVDWISELIVLENGTLFGTWNKGTNSSQFTNGTINATQNSSVGNSGWIEERIDITNHKKLLIRCSIPAIYMKFNFGLSSKTLAGIPLYNQQLETCIAFSEISTPNANYVTYELQLDNVPPGEYYITIVAVASYAIDYIALM